MIMKRAAALILLMAVMLTLPVQASTSDDVDIRINGVLMAFSNKPQIIDGTTMVPMGDVLTALGAEDVKWDGMSRQVTVSHSGRSLLLGIDIKAYQIDGVIYEMTTAPVIVNDVTMIPVRLVAEFLDCHVGWNAHARTVEILKEDLLIPEAYRAPQQYSDEDLLWLARIVHLEGYDIVVMRLNLPLLMWCLTESRQKSTRTVFMKLLWIQTIRFSSLLLTDKASAL